MKFEVQFEKLKQAVLLTEKIAGRHLTLPILSCIAIEIKKNTAVFKATNLDVGIEVTIPIKSNETGTIAVPAHTIASFLANAYNKEQIVCFEVISGNLQISLTHSKGMLKTMPPDDFPTIPTVSEETISLPTTAIIKGLRAVLYSAATSNIKPELSSVYVRRDGEQVIFAATDSFRLAEKRISIPKTAAFSDILIPFKNSADLVRTLESMGATVAMRGSKNLVSFETDDIRITSRVIDGVFPDYRQIIPKSFVTEAVLLKQDLANTLKTSMVFSDALNQIHFTIDPKRKLLEIETKNADIGENQSRIDAALTGEPLEINFNCKYISDCFQSFEADSLSLQFNGRNKPLLIKPVSGDQSFLYLVMPMNR